MGGGGYIDEEREIETERERQKERVDYMDEERERIRHVVVGKLRRG